MKVKSIKIVGKQKVYDLSVEEVEHYILENGVVTHNTGSYYAASNIYMLGRQQDKEGQELSGYNFIINIEKSRYSREKSKIPITIKFDGGISKWSGLLDIALESGIIVKSSPGWYCKVNKETGELEEKKYRAKDTDCKEFWDSILLDTSFNTWVKQNYQISNGNIIND